MVPSTLRSFMVTRPPRPRGSAVTPRCTQVSMPADWTARTSAGLRRSTARCSTLSGNGPPGSGWCPAPPPPRARGPPRGPGPDDPSRPARPQDLDLVAGPGAEAVGGPAQVDGHGQRAEGVLVQDQLARRPPHERSRDP